MRTKIIFRKNDYNLVISFWKKLERKMDRLKNVYLVNSDEEIEISYDTPSKNAGLTNKIIKLWLLDSMVVYYKEKYFTDNLVMPNSSVPFCVITKALSVFDKATDVEYCLTKCHQFNTFNTFSFYAFKMGALRYRWQEICDLFKRNFNNRFVENETFTELLKYLLTVTDKGVSEANIYINGEYILIKDKLNKNLVDPIHLTEDLGYNNLLLELIGLAPENIRVRFKLTDNPDLVKTIGDLFQNKVTFCTWQDNL